MIFILAVIIYSSLWFIFYEHDLINSDGAHYYEYFVRIFITHDLSEGWIKYPAGTTLLQLPFLFVAYAMSVILKVDLAGGHNVYFQAMVVFAGLCYSIWAFVMIYKMLKRNYTGRSALLTCIALFCGTMIPVYMMERASFSHIYGFFVSTAIMYYIIYYEKQRENRKGRILRDVALGLLFGLASIIRSTNVVMGFAYLFYRVTSIESFERRFKQVLCIRLLPQVLGFTAVYSIQMILWRVMSGNWVLYSYTGESFDYLCNPKVLEVLFSDAKGLFIFSPILFIGILSMVFFGSENEEFRISQWLIFIAVTYFISAWWCWWLGTAYSERMFCDVLCIFAIPLASFFNGLEVWQHQSEETGYLKHIVLVLCYILVTLLVLVNVVWIKGVREYRISENLASWYQLRTYLIDFLFK